MSSLILVATIYIAVLCLGSRSTRPPDSRALWLLGLGLTIVFALVGFFWEVLPVVLLLGFPLMLVAINIHLYIESKRSGVEFLRYVLRNCWFALPPVLMLGLLGYFLVVMLTAWTFDKVDSWTAPVRAQVKVIAATIQKTESQQQKNRATRTPFPTTTLQKNVIPTTTAQASVVHDCTTHAGKNLICNEKGVVLIKGKSLRLEGRPVMNAHPLMLGHPAHPRKSHSCCGPGPFETMIITFLPLVPYFFVLFIRSVTGIKIGR